MLFAFSKKVNTIVPLQVEAKALFCWLAAKLAQFFGLKKVCFESNSKSCIDALKMEGINPLENQKLVYCYAVSYVYMPLWYVSWASMDANRALSCVS